jgi:hypothetical protein
MVNFIDKARIARIAPSVFAKDHDGLRSDRYTFVSSEKIIDAFDELGWGVTAATQPTSQINKETNQPKSDPLHSKHLLRFRPRSNDLAFRDPRGNRDVFPEVVAFNSSNGTARFKLVSGAFSMICEHGMIIRVPGFEEVGDTVSRKHIGWDPQIAYNAVQEMSDSFPNFFKIVGEMTQHDLKPETRLEMAQAARTLRFGENSTIDPSILLNPARDDDAGTDIWTTFNILQERCVRGGYKLASRTARDLTNIDALDRVNTGLWTIAEETLETVLAN